MGKINKRPQVIQDLIELATYIATDNLDASERFLTAAEETFQQISKLPQMGKQCQLSNPELAEIRQQAIKGFKNHLVFYRVLNSDIEIIRVLHGARDLEAILDE
ncbi:type II toxin-antitoxin system RelE/ParE family toxin [Aphanothece hegewaldii CCALA 016]|uniref:Type II toxin-antitoxin system RelE/ParE family toxin n=1 Tax=Aphanothece hegewaldii CCALA 016 TaxID=2107694 RepID=A0A2T1LV12_9CHRO|nr:type II toxin-antitoxin system RelE/ParE family toxin [Aphanothece hegewaldii]PSF35517.1 type II toxin-antitoxin system RelE/ParE family toxin [Aphanothece hegewaldii CCALA 016]